MQRLTCHLGLCGVFSSLPLYVACDGVISFRYGAQGEGGIYRQPLPSRRRSLSPSNPELFADRAQAYLKLRNLTGFDESLRVEVVADANRAIELDAWLHKAYLRKGNACFELEEYQTAKAALEKVAAFVPGDTRFANLIKKCEECIAEESGEVLNQTPEKLPICAVSKDINRALSEVPKPETIVSNSKPKYRSDYDLKLACQFQTLHRSVLAMLILVMLLNFC